MRKGSLAPREDAKDPATREVVHGAEAANEVAKYVCRLNAKDWSIEEMPFDLKFETLFLGFWSWKGALQDRRAALHAVLRNPFDDVGVIFGAWRETCSRSPSDGQPVDAAHWAGSKAACDWLAQSKITPEESRQAIERGQRGKGRGPDDTENEHLQALDDHGQQLVHNAFTEIYESGQEPEGWQKRYVIPLPKPSTKDRHELHEHRLISLLSHFAKTYRQILARRLRVILRSKLRDTQALKHNEGCTYNTLILTQKVGERLDSGCKTFCVFIDLQKAFDTVNKRLLWGRLRSLGVAGKLLRALQAGYGKRTLIGKLGRECSEERPDVGRGVRQGEVDSSDAFAAFIDDLDAEIERCEEKLGRKLGIPLVGLGQTHKDTVPTLKHADDTVVMATTAEDLQVLLDVLSVWCKKWQITPNALKCECVVFEATGNANPELNFAGKILPVRQSVIYLGYQLTHRGSWDAHVERRLCKAEKWDGAARGMLGKTGGAPVGVVATVRETTAETGVLYGAEFTGGTGTALLEPAAHRQIHMAKEILGLRQSADNEGALTELGWTGVDTKASQARLMFWWRLGRTESALMRRLEWQAHERSSSEATGSNPSLYDWWRYTDALVERVAKRAGLTAVELRALRREPFKRVVGHILWKEEYEQRLSVCRTRARLEIPVEEMAQLAAEDARQNHKRTRWPGAPYLSFVDSKHHVRLLAMARLGLLPLEIEEGRWHGIPREKRLCKLRCGVVGDLRHFLNYCSPLTVGDVGALNRYSAEAENSGSRLFFWRAKARGLERRWRERAKLVARLRTEPSNPADAQDDAEQADVDAELKTIAERQPAAHEFRSFRSIAQPGSRAQQTNVKKPRKGKVAASDRGAQSKKSKKPRKGAKKGTGPTEG